MIGIAAVALLAVVALYFVQDNMIYHPRPYPPRYKPIESQAQRVDFTVEVGGMEYPQTAWYVPSAQDGDEGPERLLVAFGGNGTLAMEWMPLVKDMASPAHGILLVDYPGYGFSEGHPSPLSIRLGAAGAVQALVQELKLQEPFFDDRTDVMGHSLGCATALEFCRQADVSRIVLFAPFTSTLDMANMRVGPVLKHLLRDRYDNRKRLQELMQRGEAPEVLILHGGRDSIIPVRMGRELGKVDSAIRYREYPEADHVSVVDEGTEEARRFLRGSGEVLMGGEGPEMRPGGGS